MGDRLINKIAVVTGASGALGRSIVSRFLGEGAKVVLFARDRRRLEAVAEIAPARVLVVDGDVTNEQDLRRLAQATTRRFGNVDVLVAASCLYRQTTLSTIADDLVSQMFDVNCHGALRTVRALVESLNPDASIIFLSASRELTSLPAAGGFCASKAALTSIATSLVAELAPRRIRINCVAPGPCAVGQSDPSMTAVSPPGSRRSNVERASADDRTVSRALTRPSGTVVDVAEAALFLASDAAANIVGQEIVIGSRIRG